MKIDDLSLWRAFFWVAREGSFTRAAERVQMGTSALSKKISRLESDLGVRLFQRSTRRVRLTSEGKGLVPFVNSLLEDVENLESRFEDLGELRGVIRLTSITTVANRLLAPILVEFSKRHPGVKFEVDGSDHLVDLVDSQMDLAIRVTSTPTGSDVIYRKLVTNTLVFCASPDYAREHEAKLKKPRDLKHHRVLIFPQYEKCRILGTNLTVGDFAGQQFIRANGGMFITQLALGGAGVAVRSLWDVDPLLKSGRLVRVFPDHAIESFGDVYVVIPSRKFLAPRVRAFMDFLIEKSKAWPQ